LRDDFADDVQIVTKRQLGTAVDAIARAKDFIVYRSGAPALSLIDFDQKGMPEHAAKRIDELGGVWFALVHAMPALADAARLLRGSTSAGLFNVETGEKLPGSGGVHVFIGIRDGADSERFLKGLHDRCWLAGLGWLMVGGGGQLLERSIVDRVVGSPERLVFEGKPILIPPIGQNEAARRPLVEDGDLLDTVAACPPLTLFEQSKLRALRATEELRLKPDLERARTEFIERQTEKLVARGVDAERARHTARRQCKGVLLPNVELPFDDPELAGKTVADVLADPARFEGETLADPLEGVEYGVGKAKILRHSDGTPWIHSFAHGRSTYDLKVDFVAAMGAMNAAARDRAVELFVQLVLGGDLTEDEVERLRDITSRIADVGKRPLDARLKRARQEHKAERAREENNRRLAERRDPRLRADAPASDAPWLPQMQLLNDVLRRVGSDEPPGRDDSGYLAEVRSRTPLGLHTLRAAEANGDDDPAETRLPPPEHMLLTRLEEPEAAEMIEHHSIMWTQWASRCISRHPLSVISLSAAIASCRASLRSPACRWFYQAGCCFPGPVWSAISAPCSECRRNYATCCRQPRNARRVPSPARCNF
jgi:hypothetical protein